MIILCLHCAVPWGIEPPNRNGCVHADTHYLPNPSFFHCVNNLTVPSKQCADVAVQKQSWTCVTLPGCGLHFLPLLDGSWPCFPSHFGSAEPFEALRYIPGEKNRREGAKGGLHTAHLTRNRHSTCCQNTVLRGSHWLRSGSGKTILWEDQVSEGGEAFPVGDATQAACFIMLGFSKIWKYVKSFMSSNGLELVFW